MTIFGPSMKPPPGALVISIVVIVQVARPSQSKSLSIITEVRSGTNGYTTGSGSGSTVSGSTTGSGSGSTVSDDEVVVELEVEVEVEVSVEDSVELEPSPCAMIAAIYSSTVSTPSVVAPVSSSSAVDPASSSS